MARQIKLLRHDPPRRQPGRGRQLLPPGQAAHPAPARRARRRLHRGRLSALQPKDYEYFQRVRELPLKHASVARLRHDRARRSAAARTTVPASAARAPRPPVVTIVGKTWDFHVHERARHHAGREPRDDRRLDRPTCKRTAARCSTTPSTSSTASSATREYALANLAGGRGSRRAPSSSCATPTAARCPSEIAASVRRRARHRACASASTATTTATGGGERLAAVEPGATQVQGTINGIGERCGNANLVSVIANLTLKMRATTAVRPRQLARAHRGVALRLRDGEHEFRTGQPFVGQRLRPQGRHARRTRCRSTPTTYEHIDPGAVGNEPAHAGLRAGRASRTSSPRRRSTASTSTSDTPAVRHPRHAEGPGDEGYEFEGAEASFELLVRKALGRRPAVLRACGYRVNVETPRRRAASPRRRSSSCASKGMIEHTAAEGNGPVNALDQALRKALDDVLSRDLSAMRLLDYKVRMLDGTRAPPAGSGC